VLHQATFGEVDLYKGRLSRDILHKICWIHSKSTRKPHDVDKAYIPFPALNSPYVSSMESTSGSKLFLGPPRLSADGTNAFAELLSGILAHLEKIQQLKSMSLQTISSIYLSKKLFRDENLDLDLYVYYFESGP